MRHWLPILALLSGLGSLISSSLQATSQENPFDRYRTGLKGNHPEAAFVRFAADCGVDILKSEPRYAQSPNNAWVPVSDLSKALNDQETDFYATVAVWHEGNRILVEKWGMELDTGTFDRTFICLQDRKMTAAEGIDWTIPPVKLEKDRDSYPAWGYEQAWKVGLSRKWEKVRSRFVDAYERPIKESSVNAADRKDLDWQWQVYTWRDLKIPDVLLR